MPKTEWVKKLARNGTYSMLLLQEGRDAEREEKRERERKVARKRKLVSYTRIAKAVKTYKNVTAFD